MKKQLSHIISHFSRQFLFSRKTYLCLSILAAAYALGAAAGYGSLCFSQSQSVSAEGNWGLSFSEEGKSPSGNATSEELAQYDAFYAGSSDEKVLYLTFDAGYDNGNTEPILDTLKKHNVSATFFVVGTFIESEPDLVRRMAEEGHTVGNHTWHHPDMSQISSEVAFRKELESVETAYKHTTGQAMTKYYRPPRGIYSEANLSMAKALGYKTFFWSLAYVDWYENDQPTKDEAFEKLLGRIHPGAIVLLHSTSSTNAAILDELLTKWKEMGYTVRPLSELAESDSQMAASTAARSIESPAVYFSINRSYPATSSATGSMPMPAASQKTLFSR